MNSRASDISMKPISVFAGTAIAIVVAVMVTGSHSVRANETPAAAAPVEPGSAATVVLIGGGYDLHGSQGQIELNVNWVQNILTTRGHDVTTYFTDGDEIGPDVHYNVAAADQPSRYEPLSRVFGDWVLETRRYREHNVANVSGSTRRSELEPALRELIADNNDNDLLVIYNGHGSQSYSTPDQVTLNLWDNSSMSASELHELLEPNNSSLKYIFTQCYSGGFHRLSYKNPQSGLALSNAKRCGFTAESAYRLAEGCSAGIEIDDYRDYTTYFFSALSGYERNGDIISHNPDTDNDGQTSLREAHLFTLEEAMSTDLSRSSSEDYLLQWQPWYLRWLPPSKNLPNNEYARLFRELSARHDVELNDTVAIDIRSRLADVDRSMEQVQQQRIALRSDIVALQFTFQNQLASKWPALLGPYTGAYQAMAASGELDDVVASISKNADYEKLRNLQVQDEEIEKQLLELERQGTQYQKMIHLRRLALLKEQLNDYGSAEEQRDYASLVSCEEEPLGAQP